MLLDQDRFQKLSKMHLYESIPSLAHEDKWLQKEMKRKDITKMDHYNIVEHLKQTFYKNSF